MEIEEHRGAFERFIEETSDQVDRQILHLFMKGFKLDEIGARVELTGRRVSMRMRKLVLQAIKSGSTNVATVILNKTRLFETTNESSKASRKQAREYKRVRLVEAKEAWVNFDLNKALMDLEVDSIKRALTETSGNITHASLLLKLLRTTLVEKMRKYGISVKEYRPKKVEGNDEQIQ